MKKLPPLEKVYEAYSAIADGRVTLGESEALVRSSDGAKTYHVSWNGDVYTSTDNATYEQGYAGYPIIAVLLIQGRLPLDQTLAAQFAGIDWHELNVRRRRDDAAAAHEAMKQKEIAFDAADKEARRVLEALEELPVSCKRGKKILWGGTLRIVLTFVATICVRLFLLNALIKILPYELKLEELELGLWDLLWTLVSRPLQGFYSVYYAGVNLYNYPWYSVLLAVLSIQTLSGWILKGIEEKVFRENGSFAVYIRNCFVLDYCATSVMMAVSLFVLILVFPYKLLFLIQLINFFLFIIPFALEAGARFLSQRKTVREQVIMPLIDIVVYVIKIVLTYRVFTLDGLGIFLSFFVFLLIDIIHIIFAYVIKERAQPHGETEFRPITWRRWAMRGIMVIYFGALSLLGVYLLRNYSPKQAPYDMRVKALYIGKAHHLALTQEDELVNFLGESDEITNYPHVVSQGILNTSVGQNEFYAVDNSGRLLRYTSSDKEPEKMLDQIDSVCSYLDHSIAVGKDGQLWAWGHIYGYGDEVEEQPVPLLENIALGDVGRTHTLVVDRNGNAYSFGENWHGELGQGSFQKGSFPAQKILDGITQVKAGNYFSLALDQEGNLYSWGLNNLGQLGDSTTENRAEPVKILSNIQEIAVGDKYALALDYSGNLWAWGSHTRARTTSTPSILRAQVQHVADNKYEQGILPADYYYIDNSGFIRENGIRIAFTTILDSPMKYPEWIIRADTALTTVLRQYNPQFERSLLDHVWPEQQLSETPSEYEEIPAQRLQEFPAMFYNGHTYKRFDQMVGWDEAQDFCQRLGGHLVSISSQQEQDFVATMLEDNPFSQFYHIGLSNLSEGGWNWVTGEPLKYTNWSEGEPDGKSAPIINGRQLVMPEQNYGGIDAYGGGWTAGIDLDHGFICEWDELI